MFGQQQPDFRNTIGVNRDAQFNGTNPALETYRQDLQKQLFAIIDQIISIDPNTKNLEEIAKLKGLIVKRDKIKLELNPKPIIH